MIATHHHSHLGEVRSVYVTEEVPPSGYVDNEIACKVMNNSHITVRIIREK